MRIPGLRQDRGNEAYEQLPSQIICPVCGLRNDSMARFCRNCGLPLGAPRDPVRGTTSRRADLPSDHGAGIAAIVGLMAAVAVLGAAGFLILRTNNDPGTAALPTATPWVVVSVPVGGSPAPATTFALPSRIPLGSGEPASSGAPTATDQPSESAAPSGQPSAAPLVADTDFTCDPASFTDPNKGVWRVAYAQWGARAKWDELTVVLQRQAGKGNTTFSVESMGSQDAHQVSGLDPAPGNQTVLITFDGNTTIRTAIVADMGLRELDYLNVDTGTDAMYAVVGVNKDTCYRMWVPAWKKGQTVAVGDTVDLLLDVKYR